MGSAWEAGIVHTGKRIRVSIVTLWSDGRRGTEDGGGNNRNDAHPNAIVTLTPIDYQGDGAVVRAGDISMDNDILDAGYEGF